MSVRVLDGDCRDMLATLPDASVQCCVTSPPYYGLRSYLPDGHPDKHFEMGSEKTPDAYVAEMVGVFRAVRRVLREDGTLWLNIGSCFAGRRYESKSWKIRADLTDEFRIKVAQAMSAVWSGYASSEQAMQRLLLSENSEARELSVQPVRQVRGANSEPQIASGAGDGEVLLGSVRSVWQSNTQEDATTPSMHDVLQVGEAVASRYEKKQVGECLLLGSMLVSSQPEGEALSLGWRSERSVDSGSQKVAELCVRSRYPHVQAVPLDEAIGGASYQAVEKPSGVEMRCGQRNNPLPAMSSDVGAGRDGRCGRLSHGRSDTDSDLACITFSQRAIPEGFIRWCEPTSVIKPKDDIAIPAMLATALRADGWYLRSEIVWHKPNPMPENVNDRPTSAHEKVFLFAKSPRYFYDADAVAEAATYSGPPKPGRQADITSTGGKGSMGLGRSTETRNLRNVWTIATQPCSEAHFAIMAPELAERCIKAGSKTGDTILDPFGGAGTTALVADRLKRNAILIELNPEYAEIARNRIRRDAGMFSEVA